MADTKNTVDIATFISDIKTMISEKPVISEAQGRFYGKISIYFEDGKINHIERYETIK